MDRLSRVHNELIHYGIKGMKWGKRRTQSATSSDDHKKARTIAKKKLHEMSNEELKTLTTRLQLERQYKDLSKKQVSMGKRFASDLLKDVGKSYAKTAVTSGAKKLAELLKKK